ncbi:MAG TPA: hypothetical protein VKM55_24350, partial [Candidatus Lokiarchaeia archaeon]|nr:hypothetical protein [Candidatus Lokiarchaeia archaeon]
FQRIAIGFYAATCGFWLAEIIALQSSSGLISAIQDKIVEELNLFAMLFLVTALVGSILVVLSGIMLKRKYLLIAGCTAVVLLFYPLADYFFIHIKFNIYSFIFPITGIVSMVFFGIDVAILKRKYLIVFPVLAIALFALSMIIASTVIFVVIQDISQFELLVNYVLYLQNTGVCMFFPIALFTGMRMEIKTKRVMTDR